MLNFKENVDFSDGLFVMRGNVKIYDGDKLILDKDNAITNVFRKMLMYKLHRDIVDNSANIGLNTVASAGDEVNNVSYISDIKFGRGSSSSLGAKASKDDITLVSPIPSVTSDGNTTLYINSSITKNLNILFDYDNMKIQFTSELINNDSVTYVLGELSVFAKTIMLTHLFFDPIYFEAQTTKKIVYTIYLY